MEELLTALIEVNLLQTLYVAIIFAILVLSFIIIMTFAITISNKTKMIILILITIITGVIAFKISDAIINNKIETALNKVSQNTK